LILFHHPARPLNYFAEIALIKLMTSSWENASISLDNTIFGIYLRIRNTTGPITMSWYVRSLQSKWPVKRIMIKTELIPVQDLWWNRWPTLYPNNLVPLMVKDMVVFTQRYLFTLKRTRSYFKCCISFSNFLSNVLHISEVVHLGYQKRFHRLHTLCLCWTLLAFYSN